MCQSRAQSQGNPVTIFDASDRFYMCRRKLDDFGKYLEDISTKDHPGVLDLCAQFSALRAISNRASAKFEKLSGDGDQTLKARDRQLILNLEILIHEFESTIRDAHQELTAA